MVGTRKAPLKATVIQARSESITSKEVPPGPQKGKNGPGALKHVCFRCMKNKWVVDFKEGKSADLTRLSVCLFCELQLKIESQSTKLTKYEQAIEDLRKKFDKQEKQMTALQEMLDRGQPVAAPIIQSPSPSNALLESRMEAQESKTELIATRVSFLEKAKTKGVCEKNPDRRVPLDAAPVVVPYAEVLRRPQGARKENENGNKNIKATDEIITIPNRTGSSKRKKKKGVMVKEQIGAVENLLVGDSLVGKQTSQRFKHLRRDNRVLSFPGAKIATIASEIGRLVMNRNSTLIVSVGGNDLFMKSGKSGSTEKIIKDFEVLLRTIKTKVNRGIVVGLLPRRYATREHYSKAWGLNGRLLNLCKSYSLRYIDLWSTFFGESDLFWKDGIHFSSRGCNLFAEKLNRKLFKPLNRVSNVPPLRVSKVNVKGKEKKGGEHTVQPRVEVMQVDVTPSQAVISTVTGDGQKTPSKKDVVPGNAKRARSPSVSPLDVESKRARKDSSDSDIEEIPLELDPPPIADEEEPEEGNNSDDSEDTPAEDGGAGDNQGNGQGSGGTGATSG